MTADLKKTRNGAQQPGSNIYRPKGRIQHIRLKMNYSYLLGLGVLICWVSVSRVDGYYCYKCSGKVYCCKTKDEPCDNAGPCSPENGEMCPWTGKPFTAQGSHKWEKCPRDDWRKTCAEGHTYDSRKQTCVKDTSSGKVKELNLKLKEREPGYNCQKKGIFGVKRDCSVFYVCLNPNDEGLKFNCPARMCFDEGQAVCISKTENQKQNAANSKSKPEGNRFKTGPGQQDDTDKDQLFPAGVFTGYRQEAIISKFPSSIDDEYLKQIQKIEGMPIWNNSTTKTTPSTVETTTEMPTTTTTTTTTTTPTTTEESTTTETTTPTTQQPERHNCIMPGLFPDWNDCHKYWLCRPTYNHPFNTLQAIHKSCGKQYYSTLDYACVPWKPVECVYDKERKNINTLKRPIMMKRQETNRTRKPRSQATVESPKEALHVDTLHYYRRDRKVYKKQK